MDGRIKLHRKIDERGWRSKPNTFSLFIYLLTNANLTQNIYQGYTINRGDCITGINSLSKKLGISARGIRTSIEHLKTTNEIAIKTTNKFSIITVLCFDKYQSLEVIPTNKTTSKVTNNGQTTDNTIRKKEEKEYIINNDFLEFKNSWNNVPAFGIAKIGLPKVGEKTPSLEKLYLKIRKTRTLEELKNSLSGYCTRVNRNRIQDEKGYYKHRYTMTRFLSKEGIIEENLSRYIPD